ncbi:MAG TPA: group II intron reverse transcriptase/maturase, partial [Candidatus Limnocylindrales bacterium]|nr:group II intron reverse transcriptase/maturase [Candidatus Limnocylindrales bacterium]
ADPGRRFHALRDKVFRRDVLWRAWVAVRRNDGAPGIDKTTLDQVEQYGVTRLLDELATELRDGSYRPLPARRVLIPKPGSTEQRPLSIPTVADRIAQTVVALQLLPRTESIFHDDSYGYRPGRSPLDAVKKCRQRCWKKDWVLDLDVQKFFDSVDHDLMVKAVQANTDQKWVVLYVKRWLTAPMQMRDGTVVERDRGTPQGSAVSPVLANLFMHYAFDSWLEREFPAVEFERFADDAVVHCATERQARQVWAALADRLESVGLRLHPDKTKIVYCGDSNRKRKFDCISFTFLGYAFRPRESKSGKTGAIFTSFQPAMSPVALKSKSQELRRWRIHKRTAMDLGKLAEWLNPIVRGWMNYYGEFNRSEMYSLLERINTYLMRWARKKYKRLRTWKRFKAWWRGLIGREPELFAHWVWMRAYRWRG